MPDHPPLLCVDMGTTRTRTWLTNGGHLLMRSSGNFGVRDVAAGKPRSWLRSQLSQLLSSTLAGSPQAPMPAAVMAAGMITSDQGLCVVPHLRAPAGLRDLAIHLHSEQIHLSEGLVLPLHLVPGVRTGAAQPFFEAALSMDLMRGEETLCIGLLGSGQMQPGATLLNLGSHWKWIWTDKHASITRSWTVLTGEMIHAIQSNTLLASSLPQHAPQSLDPDWLARGFAEAKSSGLSRALFCVRLLHLQKQRTAEQRLSFVYGSFLQSELAQLNRLPQSPRQLLLTGNPCIAEAWATYASRAGFAAIILSEPKKEYAYLYGLATIYIARSK